MEKRLLVDIGRKYWSIAELKRLVLLLQEHKLTHLQLHLNENEGFALNFTDSLSVKNIQKICSKN